MTIKLIVFDIDGVLTEGETQSLDLGLLGELQAMNQDARRDTRLPAVTLCSGRPAPYVELMLQAIDGHLPAVYENGAGLYDPAAYRYLRHPALDQTAGMGQVRRRLAETLVRDGRANIQPGKEHMLTLFAVDPAQMTSLHVWVGEVLDSLVEQVDLVYAASCLNIISRGIHKGLGVEFLARDTGVSPAEMLGVGDSEVDLPFLSLVGASAAPSNAVPAVKEIVSYVSEQRTAAGVRDILKFFGLK
jgi:hydroxymethylpyrimidine pyrophosphatase-like HAD family hydrolase